MQKTVTINDVDLSVEYTGTERRPATWENPAEGGEVEIEAVLLDGNDVTKLLANWVMVSIREKLESTLQSDIDSERARDAEDRAVSLHEARLMLEAA